MAGRLHTVREHPRTFREALAHYIKNPPENSRVFTVHPVDAQWILETYHMPDENRSKKGSKIKLYSEDMIAGLWGLTGDTLKFSDKNLFRDGQNRLFACIKSNVPFRTHIVFGIEDRLFDVMDRGKPRGGEDVLKIAGYTNTGILAAAIRWTKLIEADRVKFRDSYEPKELLVMVRESYPTLPDFISQAQSIYKVTKIPAGQTAAILYHAAKHAPRKAGDFGQMLQVGGKVPGGAPVAKMLEKLAELQVQTQGRVHDTVRAAVMVIAWNLVASGKKGSKISFNWKVTDDFPTMK